MKVTQSVSFTSFDMSCTATNTSIQPQLLASCGQTYVIKRRIGGLFCKLSSNVWDSKGKKPKKSWNFAIHIHCTHLASKSLWSWYKRLKCLRRKILRHTGKEHAVVMENIVDDILTSLCWDGSSGCLWTAPFPDDIYPKRIQVESDSKIISSWLKRKRRKEHPPPSPLSQGQRRPIVEFWKSTSNINSSWTHLNLHWKSPCVLIPVDSKKCTKTHVWNISKHASRSE